MSRFETGVARDNRVVRVKDNGLCPTDFLNPTGELPDFALWVLSSSSRIRFQLGY
jgi:hypothetical protein